MDDLQAIWTSWTPEARAETLQIRDPEIAQILEKHLSWLWAAEIQAKNFGLQSPAFAFDPMKLPLVSKMQLQTAVSTEGGRRGVCQSASWPHDFHFDASLLPAALRHSLESEVASTRPLSRPLQPCHWVQLLQPSAPNWIAFEGQLALLVEQLVLHAHFQDRGKSAKASKTSSAPASQGARAAAGNAGAAMRNGMAASDKQRGNALSSGHALQGKPPPGSMMSGGSSPSRPPQGPSAKPAAPVSTEDPAAEDQDDEAVAGEDGDAALGGRAAKRARQRERRRMFKAQAREEAAAVVAQMQTQESPEGRQSAQRHGSTNNNAASLHHRLGNAGTAPVALSVPLHGRPVEAPPGKWAQGGPVAPPGGIRGNPMQPSISPIPPVNQMPAQRERDAPYVWQPPGIWEPVRVEVKDDSPEKPSEDGRPDDRDDLLEAACEEDTVTSSSANSASWQQAGVEAATERRRSRTGSDLPDSSIPRKVSADEVSLRRTERSADEAKVNEAATPTKASNKTGPRKVEREEALLSRAEQYAREMKRPVHQNNVGSAGSSADTANTASNNESSTALGSDALAGIGEALLGASRGPEYAGDDFNVMVERLQPEEEGSQSTDPWTGRPVGDQSVSQRGGGRGKPMSGEEPQVPFGESMFAGMGMGRGRALAPPPGLRAPGNRGHRAPGGLSKEWRLEQPIPEEEELDTDAQDRGTPNYWAADMELPSRLLLAASTAAARFGSDDDGWSKASYCGTPSMAWSKTPDTFSPPGTPLLPMRGFPDLSQQGGPLGTFGDCILPPGALAGSVVHGMHPHSMAPIPMYVTVPITMTHNCPHCGRGFAMAPEAAASLVRATAPPVSPSSMQPAQSAGQDPPNIAVSRVAQ